jgi:N6-adenosine-specific RNA methylase IME4
MVQPSDHRHLLHSSRPALIYTVVSSNRQFAEIDQQQAFYSASPENHELDRNTTRNCKTLIRPSIGEAVTDFGDLIKIAARIGGIGGILVDPPIRFKTWSRKGEGRTPQHHYRCGLFAEIATLPVATIAAPDAFLFLWWPLPSVYLVVPLMEAWGFQFSGSAFAWAKTNKTSPGWAIGCGYGTRHNIEICWLGRRGKPKRLSKGVRELIVAPRREHSRKPDEQYERIERLCAGPMPSCSPASAGPVGTRGAMRSTDLGGRHERADSAHGDAQAGRQAIRHKAIAVADILRAANVVKNPNAPAHHVRDVGVAGSNPATPTSFQTHQ